MGETRGYQTAAVIVHTTRELTREEEVALHEHAESIVLKDVRSQERLISMMRVWLYR